MNKLFGGNVKPDRKQPRNGLPVNLLARLSVVDWPEPTVCMRDTEQAEMQAQTWLRFCRLTTIDYCT